MGAVTRRQLVTPVGLSAGAGLLAGGLGPLFGSPEGAGGEGARWRYLRLDPGGVADEAYRRFAEGGSMYGLVAGVMTALARKVGEPCRSFPLHMMRYGEGGVGGWGSMCGTPNGAAAVIGLIEADKARPVPTINGLFTWYQETRLPTYYLGKKDRHSPRSIRGPVQASAGWSGAELSCRGNIVRPGLRNRPGSRRARRDPCSATFRSPGGVGPPSPSPLVLRWWSGAGA